jgi:hypothetical protein
MAMGTGLGGSLSPLAVPGTNSFLPVNQIPATASDVINIHDADAFVYRQPGVASDVIRTHPAILVASGVPVVDRIGVLPLPAVVRAQPAILTQGIGVHDAQVIYRGVVMLEHLRIALTQVTNQKARLSLADSARISSALKTALPVALSSGVGVALAQSTQLAITTIERLGLLNTVATTLKYHKSITDQVRVADTLARFFGTSVAEGIGIAQVLAGSAHKGGTIAEGVGVHDALAARFVLRATLSDSIRLHDANIMQMLYGGELTDNIELSAAYIDPGGSITTWAMNTRTGAVTEYSNFAFNSFAKLGHKYIGASESGLYELLGEDDDGTDIIADIKSGFAQWAGSRYSMFKGIYLGVRGGGDFILRLETGDGKTYDYAVAGQHMMTTKVRVGKGLRARYWSFELISTGQEFDIDTIEFVPISSDRRV